MAEQDPVKYFKSDIKRLNYYNSQFLVETDFNDEQLYHKQMRRFHNRALHTWGVVEGLQVVRVPNENKVTVSPGTAIDRLGQEIVLPKKSDAIGLDTFDAGAQVYVTIKYADVQDQGDKDTSDRQARGERYKRWTERPEVSASVVEPAADALDVILAVVKLDGNKAIADVIPSKRRYAGSRIGSSADGKEFSIHADPAGAWHFFDGGKGADRLTIDDKGNVGIGTPPTAARLSVLTTPGPYDGALMDFVVGGNYRLSLRSKAPARDTVAYYFDLVNNLGRFDNFLVFDRGNVGVGTIEPKSKLVVGGMIHSESEGFKFPDGTTQATAAASDRIPAENVAAGSFGAKVGGGDYTFPAAVYWGSSAARTETKDDASIQGSKSGFFETNRPVNYYVGANDWQHLIEARHSNNANNYALQIAGSFFDQNLYMRKTNGNGTTAWNQFVLANSSGNVGIGVADSQYKLAIRGGDKLVALPGLYNTTGDGNKRLYLSTGATGTGIAAGDWVVLGNRERKQVAAASPSGIDLISAYGPPSFTGTLYVVRPADIFRVDDWKGNQQFIINDSGNVGIGTNTPLYKLHVVAPGGFPSEDANGVSLAGSVPIVAQSSGTAFGILNSSGRQAFAMNIDSDGSTKTARGVPTFYDKYDGNWRAGISLKNGNVGIGNGDPGAKLDVAGDVKVTGKISIGDWTFEARDEDAWGAWTNVLYLSYKGMDVARFGTHQDMFQIKRFDNTTKKPTGKYFFVNVGGTGNT